MTLVPHTYSSPRTIRTIFSWSIRHTIVTKYSSVSDRDGVLVIVIVTEYSWSWWSTTCPYRFPLCSLCIRTIFSWSHTHKAIPPGVNDDVVDDDDDDRDGATEVQTNFVCSQYFFTITTNMNMRILILGILKGIRIRIRIVLAWVLAWVVVVVVLVLVRTL